MKSDISDFCEKHIDVFKIEKYSEELQLKPSVGFIVASGPKDSRGGINSAGGRHIVTS